MLIYRDTEIIKAYFKNKLIDMIDSRVGGEPIWVEEITTDYFWIQPLEDATIDMNIENNSLVASMPNMEYSFNKRDWFRFSDIHHEGEIINISDMQEEHPNTVFCLVSQQIQNDIENLGLDVYCHHWDDGTVSNWPGDKCKFEGKTIDGRYCYSYDNETTPVSIIFNTAQNGTVRSQTGNLSWRNGYCYSWERDRSGIFEQITTQRISNAVWDIINVNALTKVFLRNTTNWSNFRSGIIKSLQSVKYNIGGDIEYIRDYNNISGTSQSYQYAGLFKNDKNITNAIELLLPATTLASSCYQSMFQGCTSLVTVPQLPATTLANFCYQNMFSGCSSLVTAPELPATTLVSSCYQSMFYGCTSLVTAPELPATTLVSSCYYIMFYGCTSLVTAPELPATTLVDGCYTNMFYGCSKLNYVKCLATSKSATSCTSWLSSVSSTGTFVRPASAASIWTSGASGIPSGWTIQNA